MVTPRPRIKRQEKLPVQVAEQVRDWIAQGRLKEGDRLPPERELCDTFGVSRTVVREAIGILTAKGLLDSRTGSGSYVRTPRSEDIAASFNSYIAAQSQSLPLRQMLEVRRVFEPHVAALAAARVSESDVSELEAILALMQSKIEDPGGFAEQDLAFHVALARASGNPLFVTILEPITDSMLRLIRVGARLPGTRQEACDYHRAVLEAVKSRDVSLAARMMKDHLDQTERVTIPGLVGRPTEQN